VTSKDHIFAAINGTASGHVPLTTWCFGFPAPKHLQWETNGHPVTDWYSKRLEHLHTLPQPWELEDEFIRAEAWLSLGIDDILEVSVPWSQSAEVVACDRLIPPGGQGGSDKYPVMVRDYETPSGNRHPWPYQPFHSSPAGRHLPRHTVGRRGADD
jgi:hypothetical protein